MYTQREYAQKCIEILAKHEYATMKMKQVETRNKKKMTTNKQIVVSAKPIVVRPKANFVIYCGDASAMCFQIYRNHSISREQEHER